MVESISQPRIPESYFEHRQRFVNSWVDRWSILPNPFVAALVPALRSAGVELADFSFSNDAANLGDIFLNIVLRKWNAAIRITLDSITFMAANPNWEEAPNLVSLFDQAATIVYGVVGAEPSCQESTLWFHVTPGPLDFGKKTAELVRTDALGKGGFYGFSVYSADHTTTVDKSLRYEGAAFVRLQRTFPGNTLMADVALHLYQDEISALHLLGITDVPLG
ncbi:MAG: hypothetical protein ABI972_08805 [Acidobacteriota bacterium]